MHPGLEVKGLTDMIPLCNLSDCDIWFSSVFYNVNKIDWTE